MVELKPYKAADGVEILTRLNGLDASAEEWCAEAEGEAAYSVYYEGELIACAGIIKEREGVGLAWALYPPDIGGFHIDPKIARNKLNELMKKHNFWRVHATVRADFPSGEKYLIYMGFRWEGLMRKNEPDKTDSLLYAIVR